MTPWQWWAGEFGDVEYEGSWSLGEFRSSEEAIRAACREFPVGTNFYIIEAISSTAMKYEGADIVPFLRTRKKELLTVGPRRLATIAAPP